MPWLQLQLFEDTSKYSENAYCERAKLRNVYKIFQS